MKKEWRKNGEFGKMYKRRRKGVGGRKNED